MSRVEQIGDATLYLADCREVLPTLTGVDAVVTDPPFGTADLWKPPNIPKRRKWHLFGAGEINEWDTYQPFVLRLPDIAPSVIIWGGQFYPLPISRGWLVWNKIIRNFSTSVCELAWTNLSQPVDAFDYSHGQLANEGKEHPTQKPVPLMGWCVEMTSGTVCDPYSGSGSTGVACARLGRAGAIAKSVRVHFCRLAAASANDCNRCCSHTETVPKYIIESKSNHFDTAPRTDPQDERFADLFSEPPGE